MARVAFAFSLVVVVVMVAIVVVSVYVDVFLASSLVKTRRLFPRDHKRHV